MRNRGFTCGTEGTAVHQTRYITRGPAIPNPGHLIRTWTRYSEPGRPRPHAEQRVNMRNRGFTCGTEGTAVHQTRYITRGPAIPSLGLLIRTWTRYSEPGQSRPHAEQRVNMRNRGFTCGTRWSPSRCRARMIRHESWGSRTRPRCFSIYISEACTTTCNRDFPTPASRRVTTPATRSVLNTNSRRGLATSETSYRAEEIIAQGKPESACAGRPRRSRTCPVPRTAS